MSGRGEERSPDRRSTSRSDLRLGGRDRCALSPAAVVARTRGRILRPAARPRPLAWAHAGPAITGQEDDRGAARSAALHAAADRSPMSTSPGLDDRRPGMPTRPPTGCQGFGLEVRLLLVQRSAGGDEGQDEGRPRRAPRRCRRPRPPQTPSVVRRVETRSSSGSISGLAKEGDRRPPVRDRAGPGRPPNVHV